MTWTEKCRADEAVLNWFKRENSEYLLDLSEIVEASGFVISSAVPGLGFYREDVGEPVYSEADTFYLHEKEAKLFLEILQKVNHETNRTTDGG